MTGQGNADALTAYLRRLGIHDTPPATWETLREVHRRHVARVPYDNLDIMLGRPHGTDPATSLARVAAGGRAGYCFHQNGALETVLDGLGFTVGRRHGHVWFREEHRRLTDLNHLVLEVRGLPTEANPGGRWWPDAGLGEGLPDPLPVATGRYGTGLLEVEIGDVTDEGWSYAHHRHGSFAGLEVRSLPVDGVAVAAAHRTLSTPPDGPFTRVLAVQRVDGAVGLTLRGCVLTRLDPRARATTDLTTYAEWRAALVEELLLPVEDVPEEELRRLHARMWTTHLAWDAEGRP